MSDRDPRRRHRGGLDPDALDRRPGITEIGDVLDRVMRQLGTPGTDAVEVVFNRWADVVGGVLATRTRPVKIDDGTLVLEADEPSVVDHVRYLEPRLVARLSELLGPDRVRAVHVRVTPVRRRGSGPRDTGTDTGR